MIKVFAVSCFLLVISQLKSQDSLTTNIVALYTYPLEISNNNLKGAGWDSLKRDIAASQFVLLGENHSSPKLSELTALLLKDIKPYGFGHFIIETGPIASQKIKKLYNKDLHVYTKNLHDFLSRYKLDQSSPPAEFIAMKTDPIMYSSAFQNGYSVHGIDKEYMASYHYLFAELQPYCNNVKLRSMYKDALQQLQVYNSALRKDEDFTLSLHCAKDTQIQRFLTEIDRNPSARMIVLQIKKSWEIYGLYESNLFAQSELVRIALLKQSFGRYYYSRIQQPFKAIFKYGNMHTQRGENALGFADLGSLISELAALNGTKSLHIQNMRRYRYDSRDSILDFKKNGYELYPNFISQADKEQWMLIDLQPLRRLVQAKELKVSANELALILKNDWILMTPVDGSYEKSFNYE